MKLNHNKIIKIISGKTVNQVKKLICGEQLGEGLYRDVYVLKQDANYVVKIERSMAACDFANATEFRNYINNKELKSFSQWLAPCELISQTGQVMIQRRVSHGKRKDYPKKIPAYFTDLKLKNFGFINDKFVCCDYSFLVFPDGSFKMRQAKWWNTVPRT